MAEPEQGLSKSAQKRAKKKASDAAKAAAEEGEAPAAPKASPPNKENSGPANAKPKAKAAAKAEPTEKAPEAKPKAKGEAKAAAKSAAKAEGKAAAKGEAKAKPAAKPAAAPAEAAPPAKAAAKPAAKPEAKKAASKPAAKASAKKVVEEAPKEEEKKKAAELVTPTEIDDGTGGDWEVSSGMTKKQQKQKERKDEEKKQQVLAKSQAVATIGGKHIPGLAPVQEAAPAKASGAAAPKAAVAVVNAAAAAEKAADPQKAAEKEANSSSAVIKIPEAKIGRVIGPKGSNVKLIQEKTGVARIDTSGGDCTIVGNPEAVKKAEAAVRELIDKGYMSLAHDDFQEQFVNVHPTVFPDLIGKQGAIIQKMKKELQVEIDIPQNTQGGPASKKYKVGIAGPQKGVDTAKQVINDIIMYGHHEITHPGLVHKELEIEEHKYKFLIGTKGSEMRHIQNNYHVQVRIPREFSMNQNVVVIGEEKDVDRANAYIEKKMQEADQPRGRDRVDQADQQPDEEVDEPWMQAYIYKRK